MSYSTNEIRCYQNFFGGKETPNLTLYVHVLLKYMDFDNV